MSLPFAVILALAAVLAIAVLSVVAVRLWREVRRRERLRAEEIDRANRNCIESLEAISQAMVARQVDLVEGALRCKVLLDIIDHRLVERESWRVFQAVSAEAEPLHTHQARKALSPRERHREDRQREAIAERHERDLVHAANALQAFCRDWS